MSVVDVRVSSLWRYPVKSVGGEQMTELRLGTDGVVGDRAFALRVLLNGRILTARRVPELLAASARWLGGEVELTLPHGKAVCSDDPACDAVLSDWLGRPVALVRPSGDTAAVEEYCSAPDADWSTFDLPSWGFVDEAPVHLLSEGALRTAQGWHPGGDWDVRRFRPNIVVAAATPGRVEDGLIGGEFSIGQAVVGVTGDCKRCVMVTQPQPGLDKDRETLRSVVTNAGKALGVYAQVRRAGAVRLADQVLAVGQVAQTSAETATPERSML